MTSSKPCTIVSEEDFNALGWNGIPDGVKYDEHLLFYA